MKRRKKRFDAIKEVKAIARERVGAVKPARPSFRRVCARNPSTKRTRRRVIGPPDHSVTSLYENSGRAIRCSDGRRFRLARLSTSRRDAEARA